MLLSLPTWIIHLLTVSEWLAAMVLFERHGRYAGLPQLRVFALCMAPHLIGGLSLLAFHASGDQWPAALEAARALSYLGSLMLLCATLAMLPLRHARLSWWLVPAGIAWAGARLAAQPDGAAALLPGTNLLYLCFLVALIAVRRTDQRLFSRLSILGFWFLLVFVAVTIASMHFAVDRMNQPSLSHLDWLHGASESLLSVSNLLIALGALRKVRGDASP